MQRKIITLGQPADELASAFGLTKMAEENTHAHLSFAYNLNTDLVLTDTATTGVVDHVENFARVSTGVGAAGMGELLGREQVKYIPGQAVLARFTAIFTAGRAASLQAVGIGDIADTDALAFGYDGATFGIFHRSHGATVFIPQTAWNRPPLATDISPGRLNLYEIGFTWLGAGPLFFYRYDPTRRFRTLVHVIEYPDSAVVTSLRNPTMGFFMRAENRGNLTNLAIKVPSFGMVIEAPPTHHGIGGTFSAQKTGVGATEVPILTIRNLSTYAGAVNKVRAHIESIAIASTKDLQLRLVWSPTLTGGAGAFTEFATDRSVIETNTDRTTITAGTGRRSWGTVLEANAAAHIAMSEYDLHLEPGGWWTLTAQSVAANATVTAAINWKEEF